MALQKALEAGLIEKDKIAPAQSLASQRTTSVRPSPFSVVIQHFWKPIVNGICRMEQRLKLALTRKKRSKLTSAR